MRTTETGESLILLVWEPQIPRIPSRTAPSAKEAGSIHLLPLEQLYNSLFSASGRIHRYPTSGYEDQRAGMKLGIWELSLSFSPCSLHLLQRNRHPGSQNWRETSRRVFSPEFPNNVACLGYSFLRMKLSSLGIPGQISVFRYLIQVSLRGGPFQNLQYTWREECVFPQTCFPRHLLGTVF